jgi:hypothetical protein
MCKSDKSTAAVALEVFSVGNIVGCTQEIPEIATSSSKGNRSNARWAGNSHIDLVTCNDVNN